MELNAFTKTHGYCPLCATYHDLYADSGLIYCVLNDIQLTGWDINLYSKLSTDPSSVDINEYSSVGDRLIRVKLVKTLPIIVERRIDLLGRIEKRQVAKTQPIVIVQKNIGPPLEKGYWNQVADYMGID